MSIDALDTPGEIDEDIVQKIRMQAIELVNSTIDSIFDICPPDDEVRAELQQELQRSLMLDAVVAVGDPRDPAGVPNYRPEEQLDRFWTSVWYEYVDPTCEGILAAKALYLCKLALTVHSYQETKEITAGLTSNYYDDNECVIRTVYDPKTHTIQALRYRTLRSVIEEYLGVPDKNLMQSELSE